MGEAQKKAGQAGHAVAFSWPVEVADPITANEGATYTHEGSRNFRMHNVVPDAVIGFQSNLGSQGGDVFDGVSPTVRIGSGGDNKGNPPAVAFSCKDYGGDASVELAPTMRAMPHDGSHANGGGQLAVAFKASHFTRGKDGAPATIGFSTSSLDSPREGTSPPLKASMNGQGTGAGPSAFVAIEAAPTLTATNDPSRSPQSSEVTQQVAAVHAATMAVRRLTPRECERLQGFPDDWTAITYRGKPAADGPRYKALGNSMAVNVMRFIGERIDRHMQQRAALTITDLDYRQVRLTPAMAQVLAEMRPGKPPIHMVLAFDFETFLIQPGRTAPRLVCMSYLAMTHADTYAPQLLHAAFDREALVRSLHAALLDPGVLLIGANVSFDLLVAMAEYPELVPAVFAALDDDRIACIQLARQLADIATNQYGGRTLPDGTRVKHDYSLAGLAKRHLGVEMDKDTWRMRYGTLIDVPTSRWERGAIDYSVGDAVVTGAAFAAMLEEKHRVSVGSILLDLFRQTRAQTWLALMVARGFRVDPAMVGMLKSLILRELSDIEARLRATGLVRQDGTRDTKAATERMLAACRARGIAPKRTEKEGVALDEEACIDSGDPVLVDYAQFTSLTNILSKDIGALEEPARLGLPVQSRFDTLRETGRTSSSGGKGGKAPTFGYQLQNPRRQLGIARLAKLDPKIDEKIGVRQAFVPRPGFLLSSNDFSMFEACSWCQASIAVGRPIFRMIEALNSKKDVHLALAARWLGTSYDDVAARKKSPEVKEARQRCKPGTFGFMGGMGWRTFIEYAKNNYQVIFSEAEARSIREAWYAEWQPRPWFDFVAGLVGESDMGEVVHVGSMRRRAWVPFTVASNSFFQGLAADCAKDAGYEITREMYLGVDRQGRRSPLEGSRIVNFVHDEFLCEHPTDLAHEAAYRVAELMMEAGRRWMPDVPPSVEPALMRRWIKSAEARFDANKRLIPFEPEAA